MASCFQLVILNEVKDLALWLTRFFATEHKMTGREQGTGSGEEDMAEFCHPERSEGSYPSSHQDSSQPS